MNMMKEILIVEYVNIIQEHLNLEVQMDCGRKDGHVADNHGKNQDVHYHSTSNIHIYI